MQIQKHSNVLAIDPTSSMKNLKNLQNIDNHNNAKEVAQQFEALFLQMVLKSMRDSVEKDELFNSDSGSEQYLSMLDQQLTFNISKTNKGIGFASKIEEQIMQFINNKNNTEQIYETSEQTKFNPIKEFNPSLSTFNNQNSLDSLIQEAKQRNLEKTKSINKINEEIPPKNFVQEILKDSLVTSQKLGVKPEFILGHAALESGWGKYIPKFENGDSSYNIFSVKATPDWKGKTIDITTTEYIDGQPKKMVEKFKAYSSYKEAFKDYENLIKNTDRYKNVLNSQTSQDFSLNIKKAGYATDPNYSQKLNNVINSNRLKSSIIS